MDGSKLNVRDVDSRWREDVIKRAETCRNSAALLYLPLHSLLIWGLHVVFASQHALQQHGLGFGGLEWKGGSPLWFVRGHHWDRRIQLQRAALSHFWLDGDRGITGRPLLKTWTGLNCTRTRLVEEKHIKRNRMRQREKSQISQHLTWVIGEDSRAEYALELCIHDYSYILQRGYSAESNVVCFRERKSRTSFKHRRGTKIAQRRGWFPFF